MKVFGARFSDDAAVIESFDIHVWDVLDDTDARLIDSWSTPHVRIAWSEQYTGERRTEGDILPCGDSRIGLTERAVRLLGDLFCVDGEILPLDSDGYPTYVFHPLDIEDAIDEHATIVLEPDSNTPLAGVPRRCWRSSLLQHIAFRPERLAGRAIVGAFAFRPWDFFLTEPAAARFEEAGIRGVEITEVWHDGSTVIPFRAPRSQPPRIASPRAWSPSAGTSLTKVLVDGRSPADPAFAWPLPSHDAPGAWVRVQEPLDPGHSGLHLTTEDPWTRWPVWGMQVYEAEVGPSAVIAHDLVSANEVRLVRSLPAPEWWQRGASFIEDELPLAQWFEPQAPPRVEWRVTVETAANAFGMSSLEAAEAELGDRPNPLMGVHLQRYVPEARWNAARIQWGIAWRRAADATRPALGTTTNGSLVASNEEAADVAADLCLLRGALHDVEVPADVRDAYEAMWDAYRLGYVAIAWVDGATYVVTRPSPS